MLLSLNFYRRHLVVSRILVKWSGDNSGIFGEDASSRGVEGRRDRRIFYRRRSGVRGASLPHHKPRPRGRIPPNHAGDDLIDIGSPDDAGDFYGLISGTTTR